MSAAKVDHRKRLVIAALIGAPSLLLSLAIASYLIARFVLESQIALVELAGDVLPIAYAFLLLSLIANLALRSWTVVAALLPPALAGTVLFAPYYFMKAVAPSAGSPINAITFNVSCRNQRWDSVEAWLREAEADVVFLQELALDQAVVHLERLLDVYPHQRRERVGARECRNVLLSRHPLGEADYIRMSRSPAAYWLQRAQISLSGHSLVLYNAHFIKPVPASPSLSAIWHYDSNARDQQIQRLLDLLSAETRPFLVAGDFNMTARSAMYARMSAKAHDAFRHAGTGFGPTWSATGDSALMAWLPPLLRIDYIWYSNELRARAARVGPALGSDHRPVRATLGWATPEQRNSAP